MAGTRVNEAFTGMRTHVRRNNLRLSEVATTIVDGTTSEDVVITA